MGNEIRITFNSKRKIGMVDLPVDTLEKQLKDKWKKSEI